MYRKGTVKGSARWVASLLALTGAGMFGLGATATGAAAIGINRGGSR